MKKLIRLTESDLHNIIRKSVARIIREDNNALILKSIVDDIERTSGIRGLEVTPGENEYEVDLEDGRTVYIDYDVECDPYSHTGKGGPDPSEIIDEPTVSIESIVCFDADGAESIDIHDDGSVKATLERVIDVDYTDFDVPDEKTYQRDLYYDY